MNTSIGRIVIYHCTDEEKKLLNNQQDYAPAIITAAWTDTCINVKVIMDGVHDIWKTSVTLGEGQSQWRWPVIK